jgi:hypothetical protein
MTLQMHTLMKGCEKRAFFERVCIERKRKWKSNECEFEALAISGSQC